MIAISDVFIDNNNKLLLLLFSGKFSQGYKDVYVSE